MITTVNLLSKMEYLILFPPELLSKIIDYMNPGDYLNFHLTIIKLLNLDIGINFKRRIFNHYINTNSLPDSSLKFCTRNNYINLNYDMKYEGGDIMVIDTYLPNITQFTTDFTNRHHYKLHTNLRDNSKTEGEYIMNTNRDGKNYFNNWVKESDHKQVQNNFYLYNGILYENNDNMYSGTGICCNHVVQHDYISKKWYTSYLSEYDSVIPFNKSLYYFKMCTENKVFNKFDKAIYYNYKIIHEIIHTFLTHIHNEFSFKFQKIIDNIFESMMYELLDITGGYISGSYILQILYGEEYGRSDIDIFIGLKPCNKYKEEEVEIHITNINTIMDKYGYIRGEDTCDTFYVNGKQITIHKVINYTSKYGRPEIIQFIFNTKRRNEYTTINKDLHFSEKIGYRYEYGKVSSVSTTSYFINEDLINTFDFDVLENSFDYKRGLVIHNIPDVINKSINFNNITDKTNFKRLEKYTKRGFKITNYECYKFHKMLIERDISNQEKRIKMYKLITKLKTTLKLYIEMESDEELDEYNI